MTTHHNVFDPAVAGLPTGWALVTPPDPPPPQASPPPANLSATRSAVTPLSPKTLHPKPFPESKQIVGPKRYPTQPQQDYSYSEVPYNGPLQPIVNQPYQRYAAMAATADILSEMKSGHHQSHRRSSSAHATTQVHHVAASQFIPPPPPPDARPGQAPSIQSMQAVPFYGQTRAGSPFLVWHVCPKCNNPRSKRYHQKHPVKHGDPLPKPSPCHDCLDEEKKALATEKELEKVTDTQVREQEINITPRFLPAQSGTSQSRASREEYISGWVEQATAPREEPPEKTQHYPKPRQSYTKIKTTVYLGGRNTTSVSADNQSSPTRHIPSSQQLLYRHIEAPCHVEVRQALGDKANADDIKSSTLLRDELAATKPTTVINEAVSSTSPSARRRGKSVTGSMVREIIRDELRATPILATPFMQTYLPPRDVRSAGVVLSPLHVYTTKEPDRAEDTIPSPPSDPSSSRNSVTRAEVHKIVRRDIEDYRRAERAIDAHPEAYRHLVPKVTVEAPSQDPPFSPLPPKMQQSGGARKASDECIQPIAEDGGYDEAVSDPVPASISAARPLFSKLRMHSDDRAEYLYVSRTQQASPYQAPTTTRAATLTAPEVGYKAVENSLTQAHPDEVRKSRYRCQEVCLDEDISLEKSLYNTVASTVKPDSSISQRPPRQSPSRKERAESSYHVQNSPSTAFYGNQEDTKHASRDVLIGHNSDDRFTEVGRSTTRATAFVAADKDGCRRTIKEFGPVEKPYLDSSDEQDYQYIRRVSISDLPQRPRSAVERVRSRVGPPAPMEQKRGTIHSERSYVVDDSYHGHPLLSSARPLDSPTAAAHRASLTTSAQLSKLSLAAIDERPVGNDTYVRETYVSRSDESVGSDKTVWPGYGSRMAYKEAAALRAPPMDSVAIHRQRMSSQREEEKQRQSVRQYSGPRPEEQCSVSQRSARRPPSPPREEDIIREDRRFYRDRTESRERYIEERIIRAAARSANSHGNRDYDSNATTSSTSTAPWVESESYTRGPPLQPRSILRPPSSPPRDRPGLYSTSTRVAFASKDNIAPVPPPESEITEVDYVESTHHSRYRPRGHNTDGATSSRTTDSDEYYYERGRGRTSRRYDDIGQIEGVQDYRPAKAQVLTRALSESPSRECAEEIKKKVERKRVRVEVPSMSHGPYHAEVSPSPSMEVLTNGSHVSYDGLDDQSVPRTGKLAHQHERSPPMQRIAKSNKQEPIQPGWLRVTKVKQYIGRDGVPFEEVEEDIVLEDEARTRIACRAERPRDDRSGIGARTLDSRDARLD